MDIRKTIVFIGNREDDRQLFETAITVSGNRYSFLSLDNEPYTIGRMKRSQPFWFHAIFFDLSTPSIWGISFLREIAAIEHLKHIPVIAYIDSSSRSYVESVHESGATHCIQKTIQTDGLIGMIAKLEQESYDARHFLAAAI